MGYIVLMNILALCCVLCMMHAHDVQLDLPMETCVVCQDGMVAGETNGTLMLRCDHGNLFHERCLARWFREQKVCPLCKLPYKYSGTVTPVGDCSKHLNLQSGRKYFWSFAKTVKLMLSWICCEPIKWM